MSQYKQFFSREKMHLSQRISIISLIFSILISVVVFIAGPTTKWAGMEAFTLLLFPASISILYSLSAILYAMFSQRMLEEEEEKKLLEYRKKNVSSLLDVDEDVRFTAAHTFDNFVRYVPTGLSLFVFLLSVPALLYFWKNSSLGTEELAKLVIMPKSPINFAFLSAMLALFTFFFGIFLVGQSHVREFRFLRPVGSWQIFFALLAFIFAISSLFIHFGKNGLTSEITKTSFFLITFLTIELLFNSIIEFYRPRNSEEQRPVYESRLLSLFTEPGGIVRNFAESLDYQFGFEISHTNIWLYFRKSIIPAFMIWAIILWLFTCLAEVAPGELGIRSKFGAIDRNDKPLESGIHLKLPWPCENIVRVPVDIVKVVSVGATQQGKKVADATSKVILWTGNHYQTEDHFLVAVDHIQNSGAFPVSILEISLPIYYTADQNKIYDYAYNFDNVESTLKAIGQAEATRYFASTDFSKDISSGRQEGANILSQRIQTTCDSLELGVRIVSVNMHDAHPPVKTDPTNSKDKSVAETYQNVVCAQEEAVTLISKAHEYATRTIENAKVESMKIKGEANAYEIKVANVAMADASRFSQQLVSYKGFPKMFELRTYLDFLENDCKDTRKFIISDKINVKNYVLNLEEKASLDILDTNIDQLVKPAN